MKQKQFMNQNERNFMENLPEITQGSDAWFAQRLGKVTASRVADVIAKTKTGYSTSRDNYMAQLVCERMTNTVAESFTNSAMQWGTETEPLARAAYEAHADVLVDEVAMITHPTIEAAGASPDGLVGDDGQLEIKAPQTATHIDTLLTQTVPGKYITQMQWQMACTGRKWCDFVSFDPRLPTELQLFVKRVPRDDAYIQMLEKEVIQFLTELDGKIKKLNELKEKNGNHL
jgi:putative phage-type endonuclease